MDNDLARTSDYLRSLEITGPGIVIDRSRVQANIQGMIDRCRRDRVALRPHFKTHQCAAVGDWFRDRGTDRITVSSLGMAEYFAEFGWGDITLAFLLNPLELDRLGDLARHLVSRGGRLGLTIDSVAAAELLARSGLPVKVWIKIDAGYGRTGVVWEDEAGLTAVRDALGGAVPLAGLLTHSGHSYQARSQVNLQTIWDTALDRMRRARQLLGNDRSLKISLGDTPCCCTAASLAGADEVRPGNFVFFDLMQLEIGSCREDQLAAAAVCPVVGVYPESGRLVVQGGAVHLAKEALTDSNGQAVYGKLGLLDFAGDASPRLGAVLHEIPVVHLSQEHGIIKVPPHRFGELLGHLGIGDLVLIWPVHSCLTCDLHRAYHTLDGGVLPRR